jgi:hypothetical protein
MDQQRLAVLLAAVLIAAPANVSIGADGPLLAAKVAPGLVRKANIIIGLHDDPNATLADLDGRGSLLEVGKAFGLDAAQIDRIRQSTGYVICPVEKNPKQRFFIGSGFLALSNDQILTSRHTLDDVAETEGPEGWMRCYFQTQSRSPVKVQLLFEQSDTRQSYVLGGFSGSYRLGATTDPVDDYALVRLARPLEGVVPLDIVSTPPGIGESFLAISAWQVFLTKALDPNVPIGAIGYVRDIGSGGIYSDTDAYGGGSGGPNLRWVGSGKDRHMAVFGWTDSSGLASLDGHPYADDLDPLRRSLTYTITFRPWVIHQAKTLAQYAPDRQN